MTQLNAANLFDDGRKYSSFRPNYPADLPRYLAELCVETDCAVDVGCGTGQLTALLKSEFGSVVGVDYSLDQLDNVTRQHGVRYELGMAEQLPVIEDSADLITAAQSAHWFQLSDFYGEVQRVGKRGAVLAILCYGTPRFDDADVDALFQDLYTSKLKGFWSPVLRLVDEEYKSIEFPFDECGSYSATVSKSLSTADVLGYVSTWSAIRSAEQAGVSSILGNFSHDLLNAWPGSASVNARWSIHSRIGRVNV